MLRKTFICVAGVVVGVSVGAYSSGFFNQDNVVTTTYNEMMDRVGLEEFVDTSVSDAFHANEDGTLVSAGLDASRDGTDIGVFAETSETTTASAHASGSDTVSLAEELLAANNIRRSPKIESHEMEDDAFSQREEVSISEIDEAKAALEEAMLKREELKRQQAELERRQAELRQLELKRKRAEARRAEQERIRAEQARIQAELEQAQAVVEERFSKETYISSTGETLNYRKLSPNKLSENKLYPLVVFLHGKGERGNDNELQLKHGLKLFADDEGMKRFPAIVIAPQCPEDELWSTTLAQKDTTPSMDAQPTPAMRLVIELLDSMLLTESVDPDRVYVTGLSMGGFGTFDLITRRPTLFAAAVPVCGGGDPSPAKLRRLLKMPIWVVHGTEDKVINIDRSREMVFALESGGATPKYSELNGFGHNVWDATYSDLELYNWMFSQSKKGAIKRGSAAKSVVGLRRPTRTRPTNAAPKRVVRPTTPQVSVLPRPQTKQLNPKVLPLMGKWKVLSASQKGKQASKEALEKMSVIFEGDKFIIQTDDRQEVTKFKLSGSRNAQQIDFIPNRKDRKESAGIYEINGDKLIICWGAPGRPRPTRFVNFMNVKSLVLEKQ